MSYKSDYLIKNVRIDYLNFYDEYDENYIGDIDRFADAIQTRMVSEKFNIVKFQTNENETLLIDTSKIVSVRIIYK